MRFSMVLRVLMMIASAAALHFVGVACSGGASTAAAQAGNGGSGGGGDCLCAVPAPEVVEATCELIPEYNNRHFARHTFQGKKASDLLLLHAVGRAIPEFSPVPEGPSGSDYVPVKFAIFGNTVLASCQEPVVGVGVVFSSVSFILP